MAFDCRSPQYKQFNLSLAHTIKILAPHATCTAGANTKSIDKGAILQMTCWAETDDIGTNTALWNYSRQ